jgi:hypothetical protein
VIKPISGDNTRWSLAFTERYLTVIPCASVSPTKGTHVQSGPQSWQFHAQQRGNVGLHLQSTDQICQGRSQRTRTWRVIRVVDSIRSRYLLFQPSHLSPQSRCSARAASVAMRESISRPKVQLMSGQSRMASVLGTVRISR